MRGFILRLMIGCLVLSLGTIGLFGQTWPPLPEFSLDDHPSNMVAIPFGPWSPGAPFVAPFMSAEDEFGLGLPASMAGFVGPSPSLRLSPTGPYYDSDVLTALNPSGTPPGHVLLTRFAPPPPMGSPYYMDAVSTNNAPMSGCDLIFIEFSIDRATGGINPTTDATWNQASFNEQPGDIFRIDSPGFAHLGLFVPLPPPIANPPGGPPPWFPWTPYCGGPINPANGFTSPPYVRPGPAGMGGGGNNFVLWDHSNHLGLIPALAPYPPITPGSHDNIDAYNRWLFSLLDRGNTDIYFCLHPASAAIHGFSPADILYCTQPGGLYWPATGVYATANQMGLDIVGGPNSDSIDGIAVFDMGTTGQLDPGEDFAGFTLAPGSATLTALAGMGFPVSGATIFMTDFRTNQQTGLGYFYVYLYPSDIGVGNAPSPPLPGIPYVDINVDALELTIDPEPLPYINPITRPIIDPVTRK